MDKDKGVQFKSVRKEKKDSGEKGYGRKEFKGLL